VHNSVRKAEVNWQRGKQKRACEYDMGMKTTRECIIRIHTTDGRNKWWAVLGTLINLVVQ
jgi:ATP:corrinoid adenosyltransferase